MARQARVKSLIAPAIVDSWSQETTSITLEALYTLSNEPYLIMKIKNVIRQLPAPLGLI